MRYVFAVFAAGNTVRTFDAYEEVQRLVTRVCPGAEYRPWAVGCDGHLWREVRVADECVLTINTRLSEHELAQHGAT